MSESISSSSAPAVAVQHHLTETSSAAAPAPTTDDTAITTPAPFSTSSPSTTDTTTNKITFPHAMAYSSSAVAAHAPTAALHGVPITVVNASAAPWAPSQYHHSPTVRTTTVATAPRASNSTGSSGAANSGTNTGSGTGSGSGSGSRDGSRGDGSGGEGSGGEGSGGEGSGGDSPRDEAAGPNAAFDRGVVDPPVVAPEPDSNLFVSGLAPTVDDAALMRAFTPYGTVLSAKVMLRVATGVSRGFGFVLFASAAQAEAALAATQGAAIEGHGGRLQVTVSKHRGEIFSRVVFIRNVPPAVAPSPRFTALLDRFGHVDRTVSRVVSGGELVNCTVTYESIDCARACVAGLHGKSIFPECTVPLMAKMEEPQPVREERLRAIERHRRQQLEANAAATTAVHQSLAKDGSDQGRSNGQARRYAAANPPPSELITQTRAAERVGSVPAPTAPMGGWPTPYGYPHGMMMVPPPQPQQPQYPGSMMYPMPPMCPPHPMTGGAFGMPPPMPMPGYMWPGPQPPTGYAPPPFPGLAMPPMPYGYQSR